MELGAAYADVLPTSHRHVLQDAAKDLIDTTLQDLAASDSPGWSADNWLIGTMLPARYRLRYTGLFAQKLFVCLVTVVWKLGQREVMRPSCVAEELAAHVLIHEAEALLEVNGVHPDFDGFRDVFFEDLDFEYLYDEAYDGIEVSDVAAEMGITNLAFAEWFERFGPPETSSYTEVHPYARDNQENGDSDDEASSS
jgi:hypothetical protein